MTETERQAANRIAITSAPLNRLAGRPYYDLPASIEVMTRLYRASAVDGFEFQNLAEWDARNPPAAEPERLPAWSKSRKYAVDKVASLLRETQLPILSIHANRDVGACLCSDRKQEIQRGKTLIHESLWLAQQVGAGVCVFHLWDTWKERFDPFLLQASLSEIAPSYPGVKASVENVPTHLPDVTPFDLVQAFEWITLDLRWAALYDQLHRFEAVRARIANVHLSAQLTGARWAMNPAWFPAGLETLDFYTALDTIQARWGRSGLWTVEVYDLPGDRWHDLREAMLALRQRIRKPPA